MTSNELKHQARLQKWDWQYRTAGAAGCQRGAAPPAASRQQHITDGKERPTGIGRKDAEGRLGTFAELPVLHHHGE